MHSDFCFKTHCSQASRSSPRTRRICSQGPFAIAVQLKNDGSTLTRYPRDRGQYSAKVEACDSHAPRTRFVYRERDDQIPIPPRTRPGARERGEGNSWDQKAVKNQQKTANTQVPKVIRQDFDFQMESDFGKLYMHL